MKKEIREIEVSKIPERPVPAKSEVHAGICGGLGGKGNCARGSCTNTLVSSFLKQPVSQLSRGTVHQPCAAEQAFRRMSDQGL
jgi:hypothetical protein